MSRDAERPVIRGADEAVEAPSDLLAREDILRVLDEWADAPWRPQALVVLGGPGVGKSAVLRKWIDRRQARHGPDDRDGELLISHAIRPGQDPVTVVQSLLEQCRHLAPDAAGLGDAANLGDALQAAAAGRRPFVVVLDALDQASDPARLRELLPTPLPPNVRLLCSSRPQPGPNAGLGGPPVATSLDLDHPDWAASNAATCRAFWAAKQAEVDWLSQGRVDAALDAGQGNMLYARQLWALWRSQTAQERDSNAVPLDLDGVIDRFWRRTEGLPAALGRCVRDALGVLSLAREPLQLGQIAELAGWPGPAAGDADEAARVAADAFDQELRATFLATVWPILRSFDAETYALYHGALTDPIRRRVDGHLASLRRRILPVLMKWLGDNHRGARAYAERHLLEHCIDAADWTMAIDLCLRLDFCERWLATTDPVLVAHRVARLVEESAEGARKTTLRRLARALREQPVDWSAELGNILVTPEPPRPPPEQTQYFMVLATASPERLARIKSDAEQRLVLQPWEARQRQVKSCPAARLSDLRTAMMTGPKLLHVGCHGRDSGGPEFEYDADTEAPPTIKNFLRLVRAHRGSLEQVVFNTCHSYELGQQLIEHGIRRVICMKGVIEDDEAIRFAAVLHDRLAGGYLVQDAFDEACEACASPAPRLLAVDRALLHRRLC